MASKLRVLVPGVSKKHDWRCRFGMLLRIEIVRLVEHVAEKLPLSASLLPAALDDVIDRLGDRAFPFALVEPKDRFGDRGIPFEGREPETLGVMFLESAFFYELALKVIFLFSKPGVAPSFLPA